MALFDIEETKYDVFISYAGDDNDLYSGYISDFRAELEKKLKSHPSLKDFGGRRPEIFFDKDSMPLTGDIGPTLQKAIIESMFLVLMVTRNYLNSKWCFRELKYFRKRFKNKREKAFERTFIMVLEQEALPEVTDWPESLFGTQLPKFTHFYDDDKSGHKGGPRRRSIGGDTNKDYESVLIRMVERMEELYRAAAKAAKPISIVNPRVIPGASRSKVLLGVVSEDLVTARDRLQDMLQTQGVNALALNQNDLLCSRRKELEARVDPTMVFVQLVSYGTPVLAFNDAHGHLIMQTEILGGLGERAPKEMIWCHPADESGVVTENLADETSPVVVEYVRSVLTENTNCSTLDQLVARITGGGEFSELRQVFVESTKADKEVGRELRRKLESIWAAKYGREHIPKFYSMPWGAKFQQKLPVCRGVILLYGNKDEDALEAQVILIDKALIALDKPPAQWVAIAPPHEDRGDVFWPTFSFKNEKEIEGVVDDIYEAIVAA